MNNLLGIKGFIYFVIEASNYCNLHCEYCSNMCDVPLNPKNKNIFRRRKWDISIDDLVLFCERFKGIGENNLHCITGGEITVIPVEKIEQIIDVLSSYKRIIKILTNGFNLMGISKETINKVDTIDLGDHGINHKLIDECKKHLRSFYKGSFGVVSSEVHYDLEAARHHPINKVKQCNFMMRTLSLYGSTIYPCCAIPYVMVFNNNTLIRDELVKAGWTINNENIINTLRNWRETLPKYVIDQCKNNCWHPNYAIGGKTKITLKPNDIIKKEIKR